ncbi:hypothetical protein [Azospirillum argentinense]|uniref:hypothetical protein n=1 Tax=Azospirillum argentinense TaxID=2970906 RepID=UPI0032E02196
MFRETVTHQFNHGLDGRTLRISVTTEDDAPVPFGYQAELKGPDHLPMLMTAASLGDLLGYIADHLDPGRAAMRMWVSMQKDANARLDAYLRAVEPGLPAHYGTPVDGVRLVVETLKMRLADAERQLQAQTLASPTALGVAVPCGSGYGGRDAKADAAGIPDLSYAIQGRKPAAGGPVDG